MGLIQEGLAETGIEELSPDSKELLEVYIREIVFWSGRIHLVGKGRISTTIKEMVIDSLLLLKFSEEMGALKSDRRDRYSNAFGNDLVRVADVGSGPGFPGIVWKIARGDIDITLYERREKPLLFLDRIIALLRMDGIRAVGGEVGRNGEIYSFDLVVSKAAGRLYDMLPLAEGLLRGNGAYVTVKGSRWKEELAEAESGGMKLEASRNLPDERGAMLIFCKRANPRIQDQGASF